MSDDELDDALDIEWNLDIARVVANGLDMVPVKVIYAETFALNNNSPFQATLLRELLIRRMKDTIAGVVALCDANLSLPALLLTRSAFEVVALTFELHRRCGIYLADEKHDEMKEWLHRLLHGTKSDTGGVVAVNVLSVIDRMDKTHPGMREAYNRLSEFAHPNKNGLLNSYAQYDETNKRLNMGAEHTGLRIEMALSPLGVVFKYFCHYINELADQCKTMNDKYETETSNLRINNWQTLDGLS